MYSRTSPMGQVAIGRFSLILVLLFFIAGCSGKTVAPENVPLSVVVRNSQGKPLNRVNVKFFPQIDGLDGNYIASGVTDDKGRCELKLPGGEVSACPACQHKVQISEGGISDAAQEAYMSGDPSVSIREKKSKKNRPIPKKYTLLSSTPLLIDVSAEEPEIEIDLE